MNNSTSINMSGDEYLAYREWLTPAKWPFWVTEVITPIIVIVGLTGNTLSFLVMNSKRLRKRSYSHLLCTLAIFDSLCLLIQEINLIDRLMTDHYKKKSMFTNWPDELCKVYIFLKSLFHLMSAWLIVLMAVERLQAVCFPFRKKIIQTRSGAVMLISVLLLVLSCTQIFHLVFIGKAHGRCAPTYDRDLYIYTALKTYFYTLTLIFVLPFTIVLMSNVAVIYQIHRIRKEAGSNRPASLNKTHKTTGMLLTISFTYVLMMFPSFVITCIMLAYTNNDDVPNPEAAKLLYYMYAVYDVFSLVQYSNYCINFFIYVLCGKSFRKELRRMFTQRRKGSIFGTRTRTKEEVMRLQ